MSRTYFLENDDREDAATKAIQKERPKEGRPDHGSDETEEDTEAGDEVIESVGL